MGHTHPSVDQAKEDVMTLMAWVSSSVTHPTYTDLVTWLIDDDDRPVADLQTADIDGEGPGDVSSDAVIQEYGDSDGQFGGYEGQMWLGLARQAARSISAAFDKLDTEKRQAEDNSNSPFDQERILKTSALLHRMEAFVLTVQRALNRCTRTHQEQMYNPIHTDQVERSLRQSLEESIKWLYDHNDV